VVALRPGRERHHPPPVGIQVHEREHLPADGLVSHPEDQVVSPLRRLLDERKSENKLANAFGVHAAAGDLWF
jgi:hypothetical protein